MYEVHEYLDMYPFVSSMSFCDGEEQEEDKIANSEQQKLKEQPTKQDSWSVDSSLYILKSEKIC